MQTYWNILERVRGSTLRLTKMDEEIYEHLKTDFPEFDPAAPINEDEMKSKSGKERWRKFMMAYEKKIEDYNFGTMVRNSHKVDYDQDTSIFGESHTSWNLKLGFSVNYDLNSPPHAVLRRRDCTKQEWLE